ncbi:galactoside alpha-(1,2)-fucosyltransferase 2-like isoform X2 [Amphibalanus amphitrite]|uniref:galactoside alpha-(1,2)-fucosyltransferase 2-like isoform X2 n=1 Tax=Amphibalanus amphitrite TaxID=1232801 RepID=UPI001C901087|nr:galactoside alpha-(1,2)-fucosyltransferase 2-like isoform X2 [Amphibalanus amphitrite]
MDRSAAGVQASSGAALTSSVRSGTRVVWSSRCRLIATLVLLVTASTLLLHVQPVAWRRQVPVAPGPTGPPTGVPSTAPGPALTPQSSTTLQWAPQNTSASVPPIQTGHRTRKPDSQSHRADAAAANATVCPKAPLLTVNGGGRLGNKLCQYFTLWAEHRANFSNTSVWVAPKMAGEFSRLFGGSRSIPALSASCRPQRLVPVRMDDIAARLRQGSDVCIGGGVCNVEGFARHRAAMLAEFPWREELASAAAARLTVAAQRHACNVSSCTFIGVHMRRTDYSDWIKRRIRGTPVGTEYFQCALSLCRQRYKGAVFIVASDDIKWARANILGEDVTLAADLAPPGSLADRAAALDMATLSLCNHTVMSYGTFGFMAAFMAGGDIVVPTGFSENEHMVTDGAIRAGLPVTLLHYRTCRTVPLSQRTPYRGLALVISCDMG